MFLYHQYLEREAMGKVLSNVVAHLPRKLQHFQCRPLGLWLLPYVGLGLGHKKYEYEISHSRGRREKRETPEGEKDRTDKGEQSDRGHTTRRSKKRTSLAFT